MIFTTLEERNRVFETIQVKKDFEGLTSSQQSAIRGMYWAIEELENLCPEDIEEIYTGVRPLQATINDIAQKTINAAIDKIEVNIAEMYVSFCDTNASEGMEDERS